MNAKERARAKRRDIVRHGRSVAHAHDCRMCGEPIFCAWSRDKNGQWEWRAFDRAADTEVPGETYVSTPIGMKVVWKITGSRPAWWEHDCAAVAADAVEASRLQTRWAG